MRFRLMASRHSAFYAPFLACIEALRDEGHDVDYRLLQPGQRSHVLLRDGEVDAMQSAVSSNWGPRKQGVEPLPVHFAQINCRDGFFLAGRRLEPDFNWKSLEGKTLIADHGLQPLVMLKYAVRHNGADWSIIKIVDAGTPEKMQAAFADGVGDYVHLQAPIANGEMVASVGASMPPVAFSSICCTRPWQQTEEYSVFLQAFARAKHWTRSAPAEPVAARLAPFFPGVAPALLSLSIARYQRLGCWTGSIEIPRDLYEQALTVFESSGAIAVRHPYEEVVG